MDEPTPGGELPNGPQPMRRYDWERIILWAHLPKHIKAVALAMATFADPDGSNVRPGNALIADALDDSEATAGKSIDILVKLGLLILVSKGGPTRNPDMPGRASVYRLSSPGDTLLMRLDPDWNRLIPRAKGKTPTNRPSGRKTDPKPGSPRPPVDNQSDPNCASSRRSVDNRPDPNPTSGRRDQRPEVRDAPTRSAARTEMKPASHYQGDHPPTRTTRVVTLGGKRHLAPLPSHATDEDINHPVLAEAPDRDAHSPRLPAPSRVSEAEYAAAYQRLAHLPDGGQFLLARAIAEYADEGFGNVAATVLAVRAAQIADRHTPRSA